MMISAEARQKYIDHKGYYCPFCGSDKVDSGLVHLGKTGDAFIADVACSACGKSWKDIYGLVDVEEVPADE